jgi:OmpA-OmpF porin, OOP family
MLLRTLVTVSCVAALSMVERPARATDCSSVLSTCIDDDTFWPHAGASRFLGVGGTETVAKGKFGFGLVTSYLSRPLVVTVPTPGPPGTDENVVNDQVNGTFLWAYGVTDRLELDAALPVTFGQGGTGIGPVSGGPGVNDTAMRDLRFGFAYAIVPRVDRWAMTGRLEVVAPSGDRDQFAGERGTVFVPSVAADYRVGRWFAGAEVGLRARPVEELAGARIGTEAMVGLGVGFDVLRRDLLSIMAEARALPDLVEQNTAVQTQEGLVSSPNGTHVVPAEWTLSVRAAPLMSGDLALQLGGGGGIPGASNPNGGLELAPTTPRFRFTLSIRYAPTGRDAAAKAAPDAPPPPPAEPKPAAGPVQPLHLSEAVDTCREEPDTVDGFRSDTGCPDTDTDKDGIDDRYDKCPLDAEDYAGLADGCPEKKK